MWGVVLFFFFWKNKTLIYEHKIFSRENAIRKFNLGPFNPAQALLQMEYKLNLTVL
jgi:hypothetical protein